MQNYYRYLPVSDQDEKWGLSVLNAGCASIAPHQLYPDRSHPSHHNFSWDKGRILSEFQLIYITGGEGLMETSSMGEEKVKGGTVIFLFPGEWHRYKPDMDTGWEEYWIGFKGPVADTIFREQFLCTSSALFSIGVKEELVALMTEIIEQTKKERPGYQPLIAGALLHVLGKIHFILKQHDIQQEDKVHVIVNRAMVLLREKLGEPVNMQQVATELQVSYAWFRKMFKLYTGMAPQQYLMQLKIEKAKLLLSEPGRSVKEVAFELNFDYPLNFSKLFKEKVGLSPVQYREKFGQ